MISFDMYAPHEVVEGPEFATFDGGARSGTGTCVLATADVLRQEDGQSVLIVDQGQKFRILGLDADERDVDISRDVDLGKYLEAACTRSSMIKTLGRLAQMPTEEVDALLHTARLDEASKLIAKHPASQKLAFDILFDQVRQARADGTDIVLIDGRGLQIYGDQMHEQKLGVYGLALHVRADPLVSARRVLKEFRLLEEIPHDRQLELLKKAESIRLRNQEDTVRDADPMIMPIASAHLDLVRGLPEDPDEREWHLQDLTESFAVMVDTSHTKTIEQMVNPVAALVRHALVSARRQRISRSMLGKAKAFVLERELTANVK